MRTEHFRENAVSPMVAMLFAPNSGETFRRIYPPCHVALIFAKIRLTNVELGERFVIMDR